MGAGMLWVGWFGFNGGSALAANGDAAMAMLVTHISAAAVTYVVLKLVDKLVGLRVDEEQEVEGLDIAPHDERGYDLT
jgi:ammonia channel protein AmtB